MPNINKISLFSLTSDNCNFFVVQKTSTRQVKEYCLFGAPMPGRTFNLGEYRYGMNGQEKDDEIAQGIYTAQFWEYDSRIGRRWNTDPIVKDWESPYATFRNNPIYFADPSGLDGENPDGGCDISQKDANAGNSRVGDTYSDNTGRTFANKGGNEGWQETSSAGNSSSLSSASTGNPSASLSSVSTQGAIPKSSASTTVLDAGDKTAGWGGITISLLEATNKVERALSLLKNNQFEAIVNGKTQIISGEFYAAKAANPTISKEAFYAAKALYAADVAKGATVLKVVKAAGVIGNVAGIAITIMKISTSAKVEAKDKTGLGMGAAGFIPIVGWGVSGGYFVFDFFFPEENAFLQDHLQQGMEARQQYAKDPMNAVVCFKAGTLIYTAKGLEPIENINIGDSVYSVNTSTKLMVKSKVSKTLQRKTLGIYKIDFKTDTVYVTSEHPFYVKNVGWIPVKDLKINDILINSNKKDVTIFNITKTDESTVVYNLEVEDNHNYFITDDKILVHNKKIVEQTKKRKYRKIKNKK